MEYKRNCPECDKKLTYTDRSNYWRAVSNKSVCVNCRKMPDSLKKLYRSIGPVKKILIIKDGLKKKDLKILLEIVLIVEMKCHM